MSVISNLGTSTEIEILKNVVNLMDDLSELTCDKNFFVVGKNAVLTQCIINSVVLTGQSIVCCCENGCIADANMLTRKYRDDIFFFLYIICYDRLIVSEPDNEKDIETMGKNILLWNNNNLSNLDTNMVLKAIAKIKMLNPAVEKYNLKITFLAIGRRLNNYVHGNGKKFYNYRVWKGNQEEYLKQLNSLLDDLKYITTVFLFLLILCAPYYVSSTDYVDCLESGDNPPAESQYWVAPFIEEFIKENIGLIDESCHAYLKENTCMQI